MSAPGAPAAIPTVLDAGASFDGLLTFRGAARVDGALTGRVVADGCLVVGPRGRVEASIEVDELVVAGELTGDVVARRRVEILASGRVAGRLRAPSFSLAEGCVFDGQWETVLPGGSPPPERPAPGPSAGREEAPAAP